MAEEEQEVEVTKLSNKVLIQLKKALGMSAEEKFEARKMAAAAAGATGKAVKVGGAAMVGGIKGMFSGIGKLFKSGWWLAIFPLFTAAKWMIGGFGKILGIFKGGSILKAFKWMLKPFFWIASIWNFIKGWRGAKDLNNDNIISYAERFYQGLGKIVEFFTLGMVDAETAAKNMLKWSKAFANAILDPVGSWKKVTEWWTNFSFKESVVDPITKIWTDWKGETGKHPIVLKIKEGWKKVTEWWDKFDFVKDVATPINGFFQELPDKLSQMWSGSGAQKWSKSIADATWDFIFGKKGQNLAEPNERSGGVLGFIKTIFKKENVVAAFKMAGNAAKEIARLVKWILFGKQTESGVENWSPNSLFGFLRDKLAPKTGGADGERESIWKAIGTGAGKFIKYLAEIFTELTLSFIETLMEEMIPELTPGKQKLLTSFRAKKQKMLDFMAGKEPAKTTTDVQDMFNKIPSKTDEQGRDRVKNFRIPHPLARFGYDPNKPAGPQFFPYLYDWSGTGMEFRGAGGDMGMQDPTKGSWFNRGTMAWSKGLAGDRTMGRGAGWSNLMERTQKTAMGLNKLFKSKFGEGLFLTSGHRSDEQQSDLMKHKVGSLTGYDSHWTDKLIEYGEKMTGKKGERKYLDSNKNTQDRYDAIDYLFSDAVGFSSSHQHGRGLDFRWPRDPKTGKKINIGTLRDIVDDLYPGVHLEPEKSHIHMQPSNSMQLRMQQAQGLNAAALDKVGFGLGGLGSGGNGNVAVVDASNNQSTLAPVLPISPHAPAITSGSDTPGSG